jgi:hypothetical protein
MAENAQARYEWQAATLKMFTEEHEDLHNWLRQASVSPTVTVQ